MKKTDKNIRRWHIWRKRISAVLACIVVFVTVYAMVLPAVTLDEQAAEADPGILMEEKDTAEREEVSAAADSAESPEEKDGKGSLEEAAEDASLQKEIPEDQSRAAEEISPEEAALGREGSRASGADQSKAGSDADTAARTPDLKEEGRDFTVAAELSGKAMTLSDVRLKLEEIEEDDEAYKGYCERANEAVRKDGGKEVRLCYARIFEVSFVSGNGEVIRGGLWSIRSTSKNVPVRKMQVRSRSLALT